MAYEIYIYGEITSSDWGGITAMDVVAELKKAKNEPITLRINSPGGDVFEAEAIYNAIKRRGNVTAEIDSVAASAASYIAMAADRINIAENAQMMIHKAWTGFIAMGNDIQIKSFVDKQLELMAMLDASIAAVYSARSGRPIEEITASLLAETWYKAQAAVDAGLADSVGQKLKVKAAIRNEMKDTAKSVVSAFKNMPTNLLDDPTEGQSPTPAMQFALNRFEADLKIRLAEKHVNAEVFTPMRSAAMEKIKAISKI